VGFAWAVLLVLLGLSLGMTAPVAGLLAGSEPALAGPLAGEEGFITYPPSLYDNLNLFTAGFTAELFIFLFLLSFRPRREPLS
jgi:hypothetical protein